MDLERFIDCLAKVTLVQTCGSQPWSTVRGWSVVGGNDGSLIGRSQRAFISS